MAFQQGGARQKMTAICHEISKHPADSFNDEFCGMSVVLCAVRFGGRAYSSSERMPSTM